MRTEKPRDPDMDRSTKAWHTLAANVQIEGRVVPFSLRIREDHQGHFFYDMNALRSLKGDAASGNSDGSRSGKGGADVGGDAASNGNVSINSSDRKFAKRQGDPGDYQRILLGMSASRIRQYGIAR